MRLVSDTTGQRVEADVYRPFGEQQESPTAMPPESKGFIGERFDADAGLLFLNARYYDPRLGLFLQPDWFEVTEPGVGTNRYGYAGNDPVNLSDPGGNSTYVRPNDETERRDDYEVESVTLDDDLNIYVMEDYVDQKDWAILGQTRFQDSFISPDTLKAVGTVYFGLSFDARFSELGGFAEQMDRVSLAAASTPGQQMDVKTTTDGYSSYSGMLLDGKYMTLREIGNALAGYNASGNGQSFDNFQRVSGALHVGGALGALLAATVGKSFGDPPNYGEIDYQRTRSEYGYALDGILVRSWKSH